MRISSHICVAVGSLILGWSTSICAFDLTTIERRIIREPAYKSQPKYCLLVFGPEAKTRVWLVLDGETLYVDRNGNGDLTEDGEKVAAEKNSGDDIRTYFQAGEIHEGGLTHKELTVVVTNLDRLVADKQIKEYLAKEPKARGYSVRLNVEMPGWKGEEIGGRVFQSAGLNDLNGFLKFADKPADASVIHFRGPWQVTFNQKPQFTVGRKTSLATVVATPGLGPGTTATVWCEGLIPPNVFPTAEVLFPPAREGEPPLRELYELKGHG